jgi:hypothetical protein
MGNSTRDWSSRAKGGKIAWGISPLMPWRASERAGSYGHPRSREMTSSGTRNDGRGHSPSRPSPRRWHARPMRPGSWPAATRSVTPSPRRCEKRAQRWCRSRRSSGIPQSPPVSAMPGSRICRSSRYPYRPSGGSWRRRRSSMIVAQNRPDQQARPMASSVKRASLLKPRRYVTYSEVGYCLHNRYSV